MCTSCVLFSPWQASVVIRYWRLWEIPTFGGHQVTLARDYVVPNPREFDLREDKFSSSFWQKRCCCGPARAGPPVALRVCRAGSFFAPHVDPRRHHTCTSPSAGSCVLVDIPFLVTFSTVITWTSQGASNMYALQPKAGARVQFTTSQR